MIVKIEDGTISIQPDKIDTKFIAKNNVSIFGLVLPFFILLCILWYKENARLTTVEKTFIVVVLLTQICTLYTCLVKWNKTMLLLSHYIFILAIPFVLLCIMNNWLNLYYLGVILVTIGVWIVYDKCVFDTINMEVIWNSTSYKFKNDWMWQIMLGLFVLYGIKVAMINS
jgi:hypothetical protein